MHGLSVMGLEGVSLKCVSSVAVHACAGFYVDPLSLPNHKLTLKAVTAGAPAGMQSFAAFQFR